MEGWNAQKMLDFYIHDYMTRNNMQSTAETFAKETNIDTRNLATNPLQGFLTDWWSIFWDIYSANLENNSHATEGASFMAAENEPQNVHSSLPVPMSMPYVNSMLQNAFLTNARLGRPSNMLPTTSEIIITREGTDNLEHNVASKINLGQEMNVSRTGKAPIPDFNFRQGERFTEFLAGRRREQELPKLPVRGVNSSSQFFHVGHLASSLPPIGNSSNPEMRPNNNLQIPNRREDEVGTSDRRPMDAEPTNEPFGTQILTDTGRAGTSNHDLFAGASGNLNFFSSSSFGGSKSMSYSHVVDDGSKGKGLTTNEEMENAMVESFFANDGAQDDSDVNIDTSQPSSSAQQKTEEEGFPFELIGNFNPTTDKLSCCAFSTSGIFFAAGGHEKKVYLWNLRTNNKIVIEGHSQLITDIRFKTDSSVFATSSFDKTVQIRDAVKPNRALFSLVGLDEGVVSLDFHPKKSNLLCSCDSNDVIRLWRLNQSACFHSFKGGNRQVRFQPRLGNLLAAARGNVINLFDVETGILQHQLQGHASDVHSLCWDVDGRCLVSVSDESARIWSTVVGGKCVHELYSTTNKFTSCTFHPAYAQVVLVGSYQTIDIWNPAMANKTWTYPAHNDIVSALSHVSETNVIGSVSHDQCVRLWK